MKKIKLFVILLLTILMVPVYAKDFNVSVDSISLEEKSDGAKDLSKATFDNLNLNLNLRFFDVGDYAKYKVVVKNDSDNDYFISDDPVSDEYLKYTYTFDNDSDKLEAHSTKVVYLTVSYENEVESDKLVNNKYTANLKQAMKIVEKDGNIVNPETRSPYMIIVFSVLIFLIITSVLIFIKREKASIALVLLILLMPLSVFALETLEININTDVMIVSGLDCIHEGEVVQGTIHDGGQYTYSYMQKKAGNYWQNIDQDGWGVVLTNKDSTDPVTEPLCRTINGKPIVSMSYAFWQSKASDIDMSTFDTSKVTDMQGMFHSIETTSIDLSSFDTSNVTNMHMMFISSKVTTLDLRSFDTSKVTNMQYMFNGSQATSIDLSSFDTSNVTNMSDMFSNSQVTALDLSNFDTSNVTNMNSMFSYTNATTINMTGWDTSNVTTMSSMFYRSQAATLDLSNFDTSNVTNMSDMFANSQAATLDLSNFDTSNVTNMSGMFYNSQATEINVLSFNTSNVTNMLTMFARSQVPTLDLSSFDTSKATNRMQNMFYNSTITTGYARTQADADNLNNSSNKPAGLVFTVK